MDDGGIAVHKKPSQMCTLTATGAILPQRLETPRERFAAVCAARPQGRILLEASTASAWVAHCVEALGHEGIGAAPHDAPRDAQRSRRVKTDRREAEALAQAGRLGASHPAHRPAERQRQVRGVRAVRAAVVRSRPRWSRVVRALWRHHGARRRRGAAASVLGRGEARALSAARQAVLEPLVRALQRGNAPLAAWEQPTATMAQGEEVVERWRTAPGGGPLTALSFVAPRDAVERCDHAPHVESARGRVPRAWRAGEPPPRGTRTTHGRVRLRALVVGAAGRLVRGTGVAGEQRRRGAERLAARRGKRVAGVALARRRAGLLSARWREGSVDDEAQGGQRPRRVAVTVSPQGPSKRLSPVVQPGGRRQERCARACPWRL